LGTLTASALTYGLLHEADTNRRESRRRSRHVRNVTLGITPPPHQPPLPPNAYSPKPAACARLASRHMHTSLGVEICHAFCRLAVARASWSVYCLRPPHGRITVGARTIRAR